MMIEIILLPEKMFTVKEKKTHYKINKFFCDTLRI